MPRDLESARILLINQCPLPLSLVATYLRKGGFRHLAFASDINDALKTLQIWRPELVIADWDAGEADCTEFCAKVRGDRRGLNVPIIVETSLTDPDVKANVFAAGATDLIMKPVSAGELLARVRIHLERRRLISDLYEYQRRLADDLDQARTMQQTLLPTREDIEAVEAQYPVSLDSFYEPCFGLGGDIWGMRPLDENRLQVFCADFSGHGVGAAFNTFRLHAFMSSGLELSHSPAKWLEQANKFLCGVLPIGQYATMFCAVVDFSTSSLQYASAASPSHLIYSPRIDDEIIPIDGSGFPLGISKDAVYINRQMSFPSGSTLFVYSDALIETPSAAEPVFTPERLFAFLNVYRSEPSLEVVRKATVQALYAKSSARLPDDLTLVLLRHNAEAVAVAA